MSGRLEGRSGAYRDQDGLGRAVREAWAEGPPAPDLDALLTSLRPRLVEIDVEIEANGVRWLDRLRFWISAAPAPALAGAAGALLLAVWISVPGSETAPPPITVADVAREPTVYDLSGEGPVLLFEDSDSTVIWMIDEADDVSGFVASSADWS